MSAITNIDGFLDQQAREDAEFREKMTVRTLPCSDCGAMVTGSAVDGTWRIFEDGEGGFEGLCDGCGSTCHPDSCDCHMCREIKRTCGCPE